MPKNYLKKDTPLTRKLKALALLKGLAAQFYLILSQGMLTSFLEALSLTAIYNLGRAWRSLEASGLDWQILFQRNQHLVNINRNLIGFIQKQNSWKEAYKLLFLAIHDIQRSYPPQVLNVLGGLAGLCRLPRFSIKFLLQDVPKGATSAAMGRVRAYRKRQLTSAHMKRALIRGVETAYNQEFLAIHSGSLAEAPLVLGFINQKIMIVEHSTLRYQLNRIREATNENEESEFLKKLSDAKNILEQGSAKNIGLDNEGGPGKSVKHLKLS